MPTHDITDEQITSVSNKEKINYKVPVLHLEPQIGTTLRN